MPLFYNKLKLNSKFGGCENYNGFLNNFEIFMAFVWQTKPFKSQLSIFYI